MLVREETDFAGCIAAERAGLPHAAVQIAAWRPWLHPLIVEPLNRLRDEVGLPPDPDLAMLHRYLLIVPGPPGYQDADTPDTPLPATARAVRHVAFDRSGRSNCQPGSMRCRTGRSSTPRWGPSSTGRWACSRRSWRDCDEPVTLIVTTGRDRDPAEFGPQPAHVRIERYVPQSLLFPRCDLVITHGGTGTVLTALGHGLPMVLIPSPPTSRTMPAAARRSGWRGSSIQRNAPRSHPDGGASGVGRSRLPPQRGTAAEETARLPEPEHVVGWLEQLAAEKLPAAGAP